MNELSTDQKIQIMTVATKINFRVGEAAPNIESVLNSYKEMISAILPNTTASNNSNMLAINFSLTKNAEEATEKLIQVKKLLDEIVILGLEP